LETHEEEEEEEEGGGRLGSPQQGAAVRGGRDTGAERLLS